MAKVKTIDCNGYANRPEAWGSLDQMVSGLRSSSKQFTIEHQVNEDGSFQYLVSGSGKMVGDEKAVETEPAKAETKGKPKADETKQSKPS